MIKIIGYLLYFIGWILYREHIRFLGHYISGKGTDLQFRKRIIPYLKNILKEDITNASKIDETLLIIEASFFKEQNHYYKDIYRCLGKFLVEKTIDHINIFDYYEFYPWCRNQLHFNYCGCKKRESWEEEKVEIKFLKLNFSLTILFTRIEHEDIFKINLYGKNKILFNKMWKRKTNINQYIGEIIVFNISKSRRIEFKFSDYIFSLFGKPFYIYQEII